MSFIDAVKRCYGKYAEFEGRASRSEYWWFFLFRILIGAAVVIVEPTGKLMALVSLANFLPGLAVGIRRLHDTDRSGWTYLLLIVPLVNLVVIYWLVKKGTDGANRFGGDPLAAEVPVLPGTASG